ncbi:transposable element Tcb1 transposase [Trichonephila clavipes]|nr:transposable element Tcb1 transposase [Trichonephila clavipes]
MIEAGWSARTFEIVVPPLKPTHRSLRLEWCCTRGNYTATEWNQVVFSDKSTLNLSNDDNPVRVWRLRGEHVNPAFALQRYTDLWGAIAYNTRLPLILIRGTMTAQRYVHDILQPHVLPLMQRLPGAIFQQDNARPHTARVSQDCLCTDTKLPWPTRSPDLSPIEHIGSFLMASWASHAFERTRGNITANMERNVSRNRTELVCLNARSYRIMHSGQEGVQQGAKKEDLRRIASELELCVSDKLTVLDFMDLIKNCDRYKNDPDSVHELANLIIEERKYDESQQLELEK